ncbi:hypothetical protein PS914_01394 [Pseudomonas fluorescens]|uniref:hypothetical protein n=1 Tax=Pseudomonas fluorescens TaxID=294 RepID=UPI0012534A66|nr:hypothetical protein [Pseudomonas fluorescens]VVP72829.1 hypothetical protein PS914_01394 [Pseudomonas fluorescens]
MPAMIANDNACVLVKRSALESIAGKPAPTGNALSVLPATASRSHWKGKDYYNATYGNSPCCTEKLRASIKIIDVIHNNYV